MVIVLYPVFLEVAQDHTSLFPCLTNGSPVHPNMSKQEKNKMHIKIYLKLMLVVLQNYTENLEM